LEYEVYWKGSVKERIFDIQENQEMIKTPIGDYLAYKVSRRFEPRNTRSQVFWLAPSLDFSVIKILNDDGRREIEMKMKFFEEMN
jgi:hypothetical protein